MIPLLAALSLSVLLLSPSDLPLRVSAHSGPSPLKLTLKGDLTRIALDRIASCRLRIDRIYTSPGGLTYNERDEVPCMASAEAPLSAQVFEKALELKEPGDYSIRIVLKPVEGREMAGTTQEVKVYQGRLEVGATGSRTP